MNRRRFVVTAVGAGLASTSAPWLATAGAASEGDLAFANFGAATELLVKDYYTKALDAELVSGRKASALKRGRASAIQHVKALSDLLVNAGDVPRSRRTSSSRGRQRRSEQRETPCRPGSAWCARFSARTRPRRRR